MVLEEEIYFSTQDIAREFVKLLKDLGIVAQVRQKAPLDIRLMLSGTYTNLTTMLDEIAGDEEASEEEIEIYTESRDHLTAQHDLIAGTFEKYTIGDRIGSALIDITTGDRTLEGDENENSLEDIIEEIFLTRLLHLNDLIEIQETGIFLAKTIDPAEATLTIFADEIPVIKDEILEKYQIKSTITAGDDEEWLVAMGPDFIFLDDFSPVEEFLEEYEIDDEDSATFFTRIQIKKILVAEIMGMIKDGGKASRNDIIEEFSDRDIETKEEGSNIALHLSRNYIDAVLDDLKKTGILKGKDQKLRIAL